MKIAHLLVEQTFAQWFSGSKVVDEKNKPLKLYHGTANEFKLDSIYPLSHFGPIETQEFFGNVKSYAVFLNIKVPLRVGDFDGFHNPTTFLHLICESEFAPSQMRKDAKKMLNLINKFDTICIIHNFIKTHKLMTQQELWNASLDKQIAVIKNWHIQNGESFEEFQNNLSVCARRYPPQIITNMVIRLMGKYNFDGFVYTNYAEAKGQDCFVILRSSQCRSVKTS